MINLYAPEMPFGQRANLDFTLFVGPVTCFYHNCGGGVGTRRQAALCLSDVEHALGMEPDRVLEALEEIRGDADFPIESVCLFTACQTAFSGIDFSEIQERVEAELGLVSVHHENNRIMLAGPSRGAFGTGGSGRDDFEQLAEQIPQERGGGPSGLLVFSGSAVLAPGNELYRAARDWGFSWVQCTGQWRSRADLRLARDAGFLLVTDPAYGELAGSLAASWGIGSAVLPASYELGEIDARYQELDERFGAHAHVEEARAAAVSALEGLAGASTGKTIELMGCGQLVRALNAHGLSAESVDPWERFGNPRPGLRSGDEHYPTSGPAMRAGGPPRAVLPRAGEGWGYYALSDAAGRLEQEVSVL